MYDEYASQLINLLPELPGLDREACRRALSIAYFYVVRSRLAVGGNIPASEEISGIQTLLRQLADALESVAVFDRLAQQGPGGEGENASAFVAAEALALAAQIEATERRRVEHPKPEDVLMSTENYIAVEAALLYMIGGYDINAVSAVRELTPESPASLEGLRAGTS